VLDNGLDGI